MMKESEFSDALMRMMAAIDRALADEKRQPVSGGKVLMFPIDRAAPSQHRHKVFSGS